MCFGIPIPELNSMICYWDQIELKKPNPLGNQYPVFGPMFSRVNRYLLPEELTRSRSLHPGPLSRA